jgi:5,10-methylenetetrahydrofolate reductase
MERPKKPRKPNMPTEPTEPSKWIEGSEELEMDETLFPRDKRISVMEMCAAIQKSGADFVRIEGYGYPNIELHRAARVENAWYKEQLLKYNRDKKRHEQNLASYELKMKELQPLLDKYEEDLKVYESGKEARERAEKMAQLAQLNKDLGLPMPTGT